MVKFDVVIWHNQDGNKWEEHPVIEGDVNWEIDRKGSPSKVTFNCWKGFEYDGRVDTNLNFQEGEKVEVYRNDEKIFVGYIFAKSRSKDGWLSVTAYDQLRYFKNKDTFVYSKKKANEVLNTIVSKYSLKAGNIEDTGYVITSRVEDNITLFDIVQNALDTTILENGKMFVLYDKAGEICLQNVENMKLDLIIDADAAQDLTYTSSIDSNTYNEIELYYDNDETNIRDLYVAKDNTNINAWGKLRYTESIQTPTNADNKAKSMLKLYNQKERKLTLKDCFGDIRVRAGSSVIVRLALGDINVSNYMMVEKVTHKLNNDYHTMDLTLVGRRDFVS